MEIKSINKKLLSFVKQLRTLSNKDLEKVLINRTLLDKKYLFRKNTTTIELLENLSFRELINLCEI